jgi:hypothetical protein
MDMPLSAFHPPTHRRSNPRVRATHLVLLTAVALVFAVHPAPCPAQSLAWTDCLPAGQSSMSFACDRNTGEDVLVGYFVAPYGITRLASIEANVDFQAGGSQLPDWWAFSTCAARSDALSLGLDFSGFTACSDYWQGQAFGDFRVLVGYGGPTRQKIVVTASMDGSAVGPLVSGRSYYAFALHVSHAGTVGGCGGCSGGACFALNSITLHQVAPLSAVTLANTYDFATWQPGGYPTAPDCRGAVPARATTWGSIKSLYR